MMLIYIMSVFLVLFILYIPLPFIWGCVTRRCQKKKAVSQKTVYLTFDDGPGNRLTPQILNILNEKRIKVSFFILSKNIAGRENIIKSIIENGHLIASHSYSHHNAWKAAPWRIIADIQKGYKALNNAVSAKQIKFIFRPPCGKLNLISLLFLWFQKIPIIFWTIDCRDTWPDDKRDVHYAGRKISEDKGGIVLFHDFDRATDYLDNYVLGSLESVIKKANELGLKFSTVDELYKESAQTK